MITHTITIYRPMPSLNVLLAMHFRKRTELKHELNYQVSAQRIRGPKHFANRATITRFSPGTLDNDNLVGGCKPLVDALVRCGFFEDDSPDKCSIEYRQAKCRRENARTEIVIAL